MSEQYQNQMRALGLEAGDTVLVHSSMKALQTEQTPSAVITDLLSALGPNGTLLIPALTYASVTAGQPVFDVRETPPCIGLIPRTFFRWPGVRRSLHPTHSVCALGKLAGELTKDHIEDETPVGSHSPFMKLPGCGGKLLFIGDVLGACTFLHGVEEKTGAPYVLQKTRTHYILRDEWGRTVEKDMFAHDFAGWNQEYRRIANILRHPAIRTGRIGQAECTLIDAAALLDKAAETIRENPYYFVERSDECS